MDIVEMINECNTDEELKALARETIEGFSNLAQKENYNRKYIGADLDINPRDYHLAEPNLKTREKFDFNYLWTGYIPLGTKVVYGYCCSPTTKTSFHSGYYFYVDDDSYVYEFFKYLKGKDIETEFDIIFLAYIFVMNWLNKKRVNFNGREREDIDRLLIKDDDFFYRPTKEHSIKDFYFNGSAMCSEISLLAENLMSIFGLDVMYVVDKNHVYNIYIDHYDPEDLEKIRSYIVDFSGWVDCINEKFEVVGISPFITEIENGNQSLLKEMVEDGKRIEVNEYIVFNINGENYELSLNKKREYGIDYNKNSEKKLTLNKAL